ncbi:nicotinate-nucleotide adenylyltransferase [candidate division WOR-3 bacterium]|nr:nicotinate-nucleotide adenylyltransferase [candidate division WOR-3 bacterium]
MALKRVGLFGGMFDPPHAGHCIIAQAVLEEFKLDTVLFIPAGNPPHKRKFVPFSIRYQMTEAAIRNNPHFTISDIETRLAGKTYTIDVVRTLQKERPGELFLIIGSDQWKEFDTWKTPDALLKICRIIIVRRLGHTITRMKGRSKHIRIAHAPRIDISSTMVRDKIARCESIQYLVPREVLKYIQKLKLYQKP